MRESTSLRCLVLRLIKIFSVTSLLPGPIDKRSAVFEPVDDSGRAGDNGAIL